MSECNETAVWWIKRDIRVYDNAALADAARADRTIPLFVIEPGIWNGPDASVFHRKAQAQALKSLRRQLRKRSADLLVRVGEITEVLSAIQQQWGLDRLVSYEEIGLNHTYDRDKSVYKWCKHNAVEWCQKRYHGVIRGLKDRDNRLEKFNAFMDTDPVSIPASIDTPADVFSRWPHEIDTALQHKPDMQMTTREAGAHILAGFLNQRGLNYMGNISSMNTATKFASRVSVHLAWGTLSVREVFSTLRERKRKLEKNSHPQAGRWKRSLSAFESRLYWHSHFIQKFEDEPEMEFAPQNKAFEKIQWENDPQKLSAWKHGKTGVPMIDAALRCFIQTGYLNFRSRAMIASFASHALHISWQKILYPMAKMMADYVPGIHVPQLQMQAGVTGINTIRAYNPNKQMQDHDPQARFVKKWVPSLQESSPEAIYQHGTGETIIPEYTPPIVDEKQRRKDMVGRLYEIKKSKEAKQYADEVYQKHGSRKNR